MTPNQRKARKQRARHRKVALRDPFTGVLLEPVTLTRTGGRKVWRKACRDANRPNRQLAFAAQKAEVVGLPILPIVSAKPSKHAKGWAGHKTSRQKSAPTPDMQPRGTIPGLEPLPGSRRARRRRALNDPGRFYSRRRP